MSPNKMISLSTNILQGSLDMLAIFIGLVAIYLLVKLNQSLGGKLNSVLRFFNLGMAANAIALVWSSFFGHDYIVAGITIYIYYLFMTLGMIFFIISTHQFSSLVQS